MDHVWLLAALWIGLALLATLCAAWLRVSVALTEIVIGVAASWLVTLRWGAGGMGAGEGWITFLAGAGAVLLTFLAGTELDPVAFRKNWKDTTVLGLIGFLAPFLGAAWVARSLLGWDPRAAWLAGVALSTTSVAVVYAVLLELGLNTTPFGKVILAACFINDLGTVVALGLLFAPFTWRTGTFALGTLAALFALLWTTEHLFRHHGRRTSEFEAKFLLFALFALGWLAVWSGSEAVLPAYLIGMVLAGSVGRDHELTRRLRTLTLGLLTPFYFLRAGSFVQVPVIAGGLGTFALLFLAKATSKFAGIFPVTWIQRYPRQDAMYTTLLMSTGLTFGTISSLYGLSHGIITRSQYSFLVATVIASAVVPTWIANRFFLPRHHLRPVDGTEGDAMLEHPVEAAG
jgi:glutathione-regulated potassium-efflux system ancillary protein KefC